MGGCASKHQLVPGLAGVLFHWLRGISYVYAAILSNIRASSGRETQIFEGMLLACQSWID